MLPLWPVGQVRIRAVGHRCQLRISVVRTIVHETESESEDSPDRLGLLVRRQGRTESPGGESMHARRVLDEVLPTARLVEHSVRRQRLLRRLDCRVRLEDRLPSQRFAFGFCVRLPLIIFCCVFFHSVQVASTNRRVRDCVAPIVCLYTALCKVAL